MTIVTPACLGMIVRKNARTERWIARRIELELRFLRRMGHNEVGPDDYLNQDSHLAGFSVAMSGTDLDNAIDVLVAEGAVLGEDFAVTSSTDGVLGALPHWLVEAPPLPDAYQQKCYRVAVGHESVSP